MIKTSANVPMRGGKTGSSDRAGQSSVPSKSGGVKTTVKMPGRKYDSFYGGKPRSGGSVKTTGGC